MRRAPHGMLRPESSPSLVPTGVEIWFAAAAISSPPPCGDGMGVGVVRCGAAAPYCATPYPIPPPQGGRESRAAAPNLNLIFVQCGWIVGVTAVFLLALSAFPASAERLVASLSSHVVQITSNFTGVELTLFGIVESGPAAPPAGGYDVAVTVTGPRRSTVARHKERIFGIWINAASRTFVDVPSYLAVLSTRPFNGIAAPETLRREQVGLGNFPLTQQIGPNVADTGPDDPFRQAFVRLKSERRLYGEITNGVTFLAPTLYRAAIYVPAEAVVGDYDVDVKLFAGGAMIASTSSAFEIKTVGFEHFIANAAVNHGLAYGLATTMMAVMTGWLASILFRRD
jgi:uncharacterized protein (TIGR02186 family)